MEIRTDDMMGPSGNMQLESKQAYLTSHCSIYLLVNIFLFPHISREYLIDLHRSDEESLKEIRRFSRNYRPMATSDSDSN